MQRRWLCKARVQNFRNGQTKQAAFNFPTVDNIVLCDNTDILAEHDFIPKPNGAGPQPALPRLALRFARRHSDIVRSLERAALLQPGADYAGPRGPGRRIRRYVHDPVFLDGHPSIGELFRKLFVSLRRGGLVPVGFHDNRLHICVPAG